VSVRLRYERDTVQIEVDDDGCGFEPAAASGFGLSGMRDRVRQAEGNFVIRTAPGTGTTLRVEIPA
jgi:signal transduction histidine kinase